MSQLTDAGSGADPKGYVLVTGASRGIGRGVAERLAEQGFDLVLWARTGTDLDETAELVCKHGVVARTAVVDVADPGAVDSAGLLSLHGLASLRGVVVNAGGASWNTVEHMPPEQWRSIVATNLDGAFHTVRATLGRLRANPWAQLIGVSSDSARFSFPTRGAYCAAKAGLASLLETVRGETRETGLRVSAVALSRVDTYFRGKQPGTRPEALTITEAARVIADLFLLPCRVEIRELAASAITTTFGPYPEHHVGSERND